MALSDVFNHINISALVTHVAQLETRARAAPLHIQRSPVNKEDASSMPGSSRSAAQSSWQQPQQQASAGGRSSAEYELMLQDMRDLATELVHLFRARELANTAHGFARLGLYDRRLFQLIVGRAQPSSFNPQELSNLVWALATLQHAVPKDWLIEVLQVGGVLAGTACMAHEVAVRLTPYVACAQKL